LRIFLGLGERTHAEHGGEEQYRRQNTKKIHRYAISTHWSQWMPFESFHETLEE